MSTRLEVPKRVRRWISETHFKGTSKVGKVHLGIFHKFYWGSTWIPACAKPSQMEKWNLGLPPAGRALSYGATAPITCSRCATIYQKKQS